MLSMIRLMKISLSSNLKWTGLVVLVALVLFEYDEFNKSLTFKFENCWGLSSFSSRLVVFEVELRVDEAAIVLLVVVVLVGVGILVEVVVEVTGVEVGADGTMLIRTVTFKSECTKLKKKEQLNYMNN